MEEQTPFEMNEFIAGAIGGAVGVLIGQPFDLIKTRKMIGYNDSILNMIRKEGWLSPFRGASFPMITQGLYTSVSFSTYIWFLDQYNSPFLAGCMGGAVSTLIVTPSEVIKIGMQADHSRFVARGKMREFITNRYRTGGSFFTGFWSTFWRETPATGVYFMSYKRGKEYFGPTRMSEIISGGIAGVLSWACILPVDVVKSRIQYGFKGTMKDCAMDIIRTDGIKGLFKGAVPCLLRAFPVNAVTFLTYEEIIRQLVK